MEPATLAWLLARGVRLDDHLPDERHLVQLAAARNARRELNPGPSRLTRLARRIGLARVPTTTAPTSCACAA